MYSIIFIRSLSFISLLSYLTSILSIYSTSTFLLSQRIITFPMITFTLLLKIRMIQTDGPIHFELNW